MASVTGQDMLRKLTDFGAFCLDPRKDIEVFGMFGAGNLGDEAMLVAAREVLGKRRTVAWKTYPRHPWLNRLVGARRHRHLLVGGGTLIYGGKTGWLDYVEGRARKGARLSFFGTGIAFTDDQIRTRSDSFERWGKLLRSAENLCLRGPSSVAVARAMGAEAEVFGDFALLLQDRRIILEDHSRRRNIIGLNFGKCLGDQDHFEAQAAELVRNLASRFELVFHAVVEGDLAVIRRIQEAAGLDPDKARTERHFYDPHAFMQSVRDYKAFFGLKLHAAGLAMMAGVPTLMVAYLPKARDFMDALTERSDLLVDLPMTADDCLARLEKLIAEPERHVLTDTISALSANQKKRLLMAFPSEG